MSVQGHIAGIGEQDLLAYFLDLEVVHGVAELAVDHESRQLAHEFLEFVHVHGFQIQFLGYFEYTRCIQ
jgi:hypothetical protein